MKLSGMKIERIIRKHYATARMANGRFYLHQLLENGFFAWSTENDTGVKEILSENEKAIEEIDPITGLQLYQLASSNNGDLESAFQLLRRTPYLLAQRKAD